MITKLTLNKNEMFGNSSVTYFPLLTDNYLVVESNATGNTNFYFHIVIKNSASVTLREIKAVPNQPGRLTMNLTTILKDYMSELELPSVVANERDLYLSQFKIYVYEYYNNTLQDSENIDIYIYNSKPRTVNDEYNYQFQILNSNMKLFLTKRLISNQIKLDRGSIFPIGVAMRKEYDSGYCIYTINIILHLYNGNQYNYLYVSEYMPINMIEIININLTKIILDNFTPELISDAVAVQVDINETKTGLFETIYLNVVTCKNEYNVLFLNDFGVYESVLFFDGINTTDTKITTYKQKENLYLDTYYKGGTTNVNAHQATTINLWTDWLDDVSCEYISNSIMASKAVYLQTVDYAGNISFEKITPIAKTVKHVTNEYETLTNVNLTFELSNYDNL